MPMYFDNAKKQFAENLQLFGDPHSEPEKYNLYSGMLNIAKGLNDMEHRLSQLEREVMTLRQALAASLS